MPETRRAPRNKTIDLAENEIAELRKQLVRPTPGELIDFRDRIICADAFRALKLLPHNTFDLLFADPPYNLTKYFGTEKFKGISLEEYETWLDSWLALAVPLLAPTASVYICGDWRSAAAIQRVGMKYFTLQTGSHGDAKRPRRKSQLEKCLGDIWFFTVSDEFTFNLEAVKVRRKVIAPLHRNGAPKDWEKSAEGNSQLRPPRTLDAI